MVKTKLGDGTDESQEGTAVAGSENALSSVAKWGQDTIKDVMTESQKAPWISVRLSEREGINITEFLEFGANGFPLTPKEKKGTNEEESIFDLFGNLNEEKEKLKEEMTKRITKEDAYLLPNSIFLIFRAIKDELEKKNFPYDENKGFFIKYDYTETYSDSSKEGVEYSFYDSKNVLYKGKILLSGVRIHSKAKSDLVKEISELVAKLEKKGYRLKGKMEAENYSSSKKELETLRELDQINLPTTNSDWFLNLISVGTNGGPYGGVYFDDTNFNGDKIIQDITEYLSYMPDRTKKYKLLTEMDMGGSRGVYNSYTSTISYSGSKNYAKPKDNIYFIYNSKMKSWNYGNLTFLEVQILKFLKMGQITESIEK